MREEYKEIINVRTGKVTAEAAVSNPFPVVGETVSITAKTKWGKSTTFVTDDGGGVTDTTTNDNIVGQSDSKLLTIAKQGELAQQFTAKNSVSTVELTKRIYAIEPQTSPYFNASLTKEIIRNDGEETTLVVVGENGYDISRDITLSVEVYKENTETAPLFSTTQATLNETRDGYMVPISITGEHSRGIYDIVVKLTDKATNVTFEKRFFKLLTVTPSLSPRPTADTPFVELETTSAQTSYMNGESKLFKGKLYNVGEGRYYFELVIPRGEDHTSYYPAIDISGLPAGTTIVLKDDPEEPPGYHRRLLLKGNSPSSVSNRNGTPNATYDNPLIITLDSETPYHIPFIYYNGINITNNVRNVVFDGRGYHNLSKGLKVHRYDTEVWGESCIGCGDGFGDCEFFEVEVYDAVFAGFFIKTDPKPDRPWYWRGNWSLDNLRIHHCHIHDTGGEGCYLGYFSTDTITRRNEAGQQVSYRAHALNSVRLYRNLWEHNGYDSIQLNNGFDVEICHNTLLESGYKGEASQASGMSMGIQGKVYNNVIRDFEGPGIQVGPLGQLEIFNNVISGIREGNMSLMLLFSASAPEHNPNGDGVNNDLPILIYNNVLESYKACVTARNTVQFLNVNIIDNLLISQTDFVAGQTVATMEEWHKKALGNVYKKYKEIDFNDLDTLKIGDSRNGDYRIAGDSPLANAGIGRYFKYAADGYKNWFGGVYTAGPYLGRIKDPAIVDEPLSAVSMSINDGAATSVDRDVKVKFTMRGKAQQYRLAETEDLSGTAWKDLLDENAFILSSAIGVKTLYGQLANISQESNVVSAEIELVKRILSILTLSVNGGATKTYNREVDVETTITTGMTAKSIMISENSDFTDAVWMPYAATVGFVLSESYGAKTLYVKVCDESGDESVASSVEIELAERGQLNCTISIGWTSAEISSSAPVNGVMYDEALEINKISLTARNEDSKIKWHTGEDAGRVWNKVGGSPVYLDVSKGAVTGDDTGIYPDEVLYHNVIAGSTHTSYRELQFELPAGNYNLKLYCSTIATRDSTAAIRYMAVTKDASEAEVETMVPLPEGYNPINNLTSWLTVPVTIGADGYLVLKWGVENPTGYLYCPLNIIKIEQV